MHDRRLGLGGGPRLALSCVVGLLLGGCPSLSTLQTPETVPEGSVRFAVGIEAVGVSSDEGSVTAPQAEFGVRYGLADDLDIGGKFYFLGAEVGMKWQFLRGDLDMAVAPAISGFSYSTSDSSTDESASITFLYFHLPLLVGVDLSDRITLGFGPKFLYALVFGDSSTTESEFADGLLGGGYGQIAFRIGNAFWIAPEINIYTPFTGSDPFGSVIWQGGIGLMFGGGPQVARTEEAYPPQPQPDPWQPAGPGAAPPAYEPQPAVPPGY